MFLAVMLIIVAVLVFYNEYNKSMNIAEIGLLIVALIAIIRASMNYVSLTDTAIMETFTNITQHNKSKNNKSKNNKSNNNNSMNNQMNDEDVMDADIILESNMSKEYFDSDDDSNINISSHRKMQTTPQTTQSTLNALEQNKIDKDAVSQVNSILGISGFSNIPNKIQNSQSNFKNIMPQASSQNASSVDSVFNPEIRIGGKSMQNNLDSQGMNMTYFNSLDVANVNNLASTASRVGAGDNMTFPKTMNPSSNLWSSDLDYMDLSTNWSQSLDDYNKGKWNPNTFAKINNYTENYIPSVYGMSTPTSENANHKSNFDDIVATTQPATTQPATTQSNTTQSNTRKISEESGYNNLSLNESGDILIKNYTEAKKWIPGYTYIPPVYWDVPQKHLNESSAKYPNVHKLTGLVDRGLPINALELNPDGSIAETEDTVSLTNVGSILPKFNYQETPFSKPYI